MTKKFKTFNAVLLSAVLLGTVFAATNINQQANAFHDSGQIQLFAFGPDLWTDPDSLGTVNVTLDVFEGCLDEAGILLDEHDMQWVYTVENLTYDPIPGTTSGFSGFNLAFNGAIPEFYNQISPTTNGPWNQNSFTIGPPFNAEWDAPGAQNGILGIMPGQTDQFSFCTAERVPVLGNDPPSNGGFGMGINGWAHTWTFGQTFIFNQPVWIPGALFGEGITCEDTTDHKICKKAKYITEDGDAIIEVGEVVDFLVVFSIFNPSTTTTWSNVEVTDNFGAEQDVTCLDPAAEITFKKGASAKNVLTWTLGDVAPEAGANLLCESQTNEDPSGEQRYTECGIHEFNSGAVLKYTIPKENGKGEQKQSAESGNILVEVFTVDQAGDCDMDGLIDSQDGFPFDHDNDGIPDFVDTDDDNDGILDVDDPFPMDFDNDGVKNDGTDQCPLEAGPEINNGCPIIP